MEQVEVLAKIVDDAIRSDGNVTEENQVTVHPRSAGADAPHPEHLSKDLDQIESQLAAAESDSNQTSWLRDRLSLLLARVEWVKQDEPRGFLKERIQKMLQRVKHEQ